jgi:hypothetical protein
MIVGDWAHLSTQQIGRVAEYMARIEFTRQGYRVYTPDVDDAGVDMLVHREDRGYLRVQVKSLRSASYVFMRKSYFQPVDDLALCLILIGDDGARMFLVPATRWLSPDSVFVSRDYEGLKSAPEFGVSLTKKGLAALQEFAFG